MYSIRTATLQEIPLIRELASKTWPATYLHLIGQEQVDYMFEMMYSEESLRRQMTEEKQTFFIAEVDGTPAGYLSIEPKEGNEFIFQKIYVVPDYQGKGVGRFLVEQGMAYLKAEYPAPIQITLYVNRDNKAVNFYQRIGFEVIDTRDLHIGNGFYMNDYIMGIAINE